MITLDDEAQLKRKRICCYCVKEPFLKKEIQTRGKRLKCSYCEAVDRCYTLEIISQRVEDAFESHYQTTATQPSDWEYALQKDKESSHHWEREGVCTKDAIEAAASIPDEAASDIQKILEFKYYDWEGITEETEFDSETCYEPKGFGDQFWQKEWSEFERLLKTEARYFSKQGLRHLTTIFEGISQLRTTDDRSVIVEAGPGTTLTALYRARVFQADSKLQEALTRPDFHLGSPPSTFAVAGRMNANGISVFYGASASDVALAEVRPPVGSQVTISRFEIIRPLRLIDLSALGIIASPGSIFDETYAGRIEKAMFLRSLSKRITKPVMPNDESFEYLATQAIADFLASDTDLSIDGIVFPSAQVAGESVNVVLFHKAALVKELDIPKGTEIEARLGEYGEDGWESFYNVVERTPKVIEEKAMPSRADNYRMLFGENWKDEEPIGRIPALQIDLDSISIYQIRSVAFTHEVFPVSRYRYEKNDYFVPKDE